MPLLNHSSYRPPTLLASGHLQTILPNYLAHGPNVSYTRERLPTPDGDHLALDWASVNSDRLVVVNHGLCGHSRRHYALYLADAFNRQGWDCLVWNYRGTSEDPEPHEQPAYTTNNSSDELALVIRHAIDSRHYRKVGIAGFSMGGNLGLLYLGRHADQLPEPVAGAALFCATIDLTASCHAIHRFPNRIYERHFLSRLIRMAAERHRQFPGQLPAPAPSHIHSFQDFDDAITAPACGFRNALDYYRTASSAAYIHQLNRPALLVQPLNDPFLDGLCYPTQDARDSQCLFLETPRSGGHCGFITLHDTWWPARRACEFLAPLLNGD